MTIAKTWKCVAGDRKQFDFLQVGGNDVSFYDLRTIFGTDEATRKRTTRGRCIPPRLGEVARNFLHRTCPSVLDAEAFVELARAHIPPQRLRFMMTVSMRRRVAVGSVEMDSRRLERNTHRDRRIAFQPLNQNSGTPQPSVKLAGIQLRRGLGDWPRRDSGRKQLARGRLRPQ